MEEYTKVVERLKELKQEAIKIEMEQAILRKRLKNEFKTVTGL